MKCFDYLNYGEPKAKIGDIIIFAEWEGERVWASQMVVRSARFEPIGGWSYGDMDRRSTDACLGDDFFGCSETFLLKNLTTGKSFKI